MLASTLFTLLMTMSESRELKPGLRGDKEILVGDEHLATRHASGMAAVFSTPTMVALMEGTAADSVLPLLPAGSTTVGARVDIRHLAATPPGMKVRIHSELVAVEERNLTFRVWAEDEHEPIGEGMHYRVVVDRARFEARIARKAAGAPS